MRLLADTNITAPAVRALRAAGHDVLYAAERDTDPGDLALLNEATAEQRVLLTKDHDFGALIFRDLAPHAGVLLIDDLGSAREEAELLLQVIEHAGERLQSGDFMRAGARDLRDR